MQPQRHMKPRSIRGKRAFHSSMPAFRSAAGFFKPSAHALGVQVPAAVAPMRPYVSHLSRPRVWQPAPPAVHGCGQQGPWPVQQHRPQQHQQQQQQAPQQLKKRVRRARQRRQQRQRRAFARQQQKQQPMLFAPPAPLLDNEFYMARAERERQEQGVRQMDYFLYPAAAAAGAGDRQQAVMFAPAAPLVNNELLMARAEQERAGAAVLLQQQQQPLPQQQAVSSALFAPLTPAVDEQPLAGSQAVSPAAAPVVLLQLQQQLQKVHIQEISCSQQQPQQQSLLEADDEQQQQDEGEANFTLEEVCSWYPVVQASLKSTQRVNLPADVAGRQPDAPGFFSVLTRTVSDASSRC